MRRSLYILSAALLLSACSLDDAQWVEVREFDYAFVGEDGHLIKEDGQVSVPAEGGSLSVKILSNGPVTLTPRGEIPSWAQLEGALSFEGDGVVTAEMEVNEGLRRGFVLDVESPGMESFSVVFRQEGVTPQLQCAEPYLSVPGSAASRVNYEVLTNIPADELTLTAAGEEEWVVSYGMDASGSVEVSVPANSSSTSRKAQFTLSYVDGWQVDHRLDLFLTQASASDTFGTPIGFAALRALSPGVIEGDYTLTGIVVSDCRSVNMEANPVLTSDQAGSFRNTGVKETVFEAVMQAVDTTASARTAYLESEDGSYGVRLVFDDPTGNVLSFGTLLTISLEGAQLQREENPERYTLAGIRPSMMLHSQAGATVPEKIRTIAGLSDADVYTFVSLSNVEFPVKEGSYTDIRENHALWSPVNDAAVSETDSKRYFYMDGYVNLLTDDAGGAICTPVNMLCRWRKPEGGIPQGAGTARGVIVHNDIPRYGDAGRYQLRVVDGSGFEGLGEASAWKDIASWDNGTVKPSAGDAVLQVTKTGATLADEHSYKSITAATKRTCGISDTYRSLRVNSAVSGWYDWAEDGTVAGYNGLEIDFSTEGLSGDTGIMVAFRFYCGRSGTASTFQAYPSRWCVDWSLDGGESFAPAGNALTTDEPYVHLRTIATYTLQWGSFKIPTSAYSGIGPSCHAFMLPPEALGKASVKVRIRPYDTTMSVMPTLFTDPVEVSQVTASTAISDYVSFQDIFIRYR